MYVAVKGGEKAIAAAHQLLEYQRRGNTQIPAIDCEQIEQQLGLAVDRVMTEGVFTIANWLHWRLSRPAVIWWKPFSCYGPIAPLCPV